MTQAPPRAVNSALVYEATNLVNGHRYIGFTCQGLARREWQHRVSVTHKGVGSTKFKAALREHGNHNFVFKVLADFDGDEELGLAYEAEAIAKYRPEYNLRGGGGSGGAIAIETRQKMSAVQKGRPSPLRGKPISEAHRRAISKGKTGVPRDQKEKDRLKTLNVGRKQSAETVAKRSATLLLVGTRNKSVLCLDDERTFRSATAAGLFYGATVKQISAAILNGRMYNGRRFVYVGNKV